MRGGREELSDDLGWRRGRIRGELLWRVRLCGGLHLGAVLLVIGGVSVPTGFSQ
jgi:hypothetical protein